jgi:hypothetical protein
MSHVLNTQAAVMVAKANAALLLIAITYFGPSLFGYRYGVYMKLAIEKTLTMERETAFFSGVWPRVPETQPRITELTE